MKKYWQYFKNSLSLATAYRGSTFIWSLISTIGIFAALMVWLAVYGDKQEIAGFSKESLISYYLMLFLLEQLIETYPQHRLAEEIRRGFLSSFLLKPFPYLLNRSIVTIGGKFLQFILNVPALILVFCFFKNYFVIQGNALTISLVFLSSLLSFTLQLLLGLLIGLLAFWVQKVHNFSSIYQLVFQLFGGQMVPLALFPKTIQAVAGVLPFRYVYSLPLEIYFERINTTAVFHGLFIQAVWVLSTFAFLRFAWKRGLKQYAAFGG